MEKRKTYKQKIQWKKALIAIVVVFLIGVSIVITCIPNGWKQVYAVFGLSEFGDQADAYPFSVHVLDVGKADAIIIQCGTNFMLIDSGMQDDGDEVVAYLEKRGATHLQYAVNTHPDNDHLGGFPTVLQQTSVNVFLEPEILPELLENNQDYANVSQILEEKKILRRSISAGETFHLGGAEIEVLSPQSEEKLDSTNNSSLVFRITYGETSFLLMGDAEEDAEAQLLKNGAELRSDFLKVGHHGSQTSTTQKFLEAVNPKIAAISVGEDRNNLPKDEVLQRLQKQGVETYRTDLDGSLIFASDGETVHVMTEKEFT